MPPIFFNKLELNTLKSVRKMSFKGKYFLINDQKHELYVNMHWK